MSAVTPWHENDELWEELLPVLTDVNTLNAAPEEARQATDLLGLNPGAHVLDLGCGPGRHTAALAALGYNVTGVDRTALYLEHARCRLASEGLAAELVQETMLTFRREAAFDGAVCLFTSFGYFDDREDDAQVLRNVRASLKPGARLVLETIGKETLARIFDPKHWQELNNGRYWLQEREMVPGWGKMRNHWVFVGGGERREFEFEHRIYSGVELRDLFCQAGFAEVDIYGGLDGRPYDREAMRLVVTGRK